MTRFSVIIPCHNAGPWIQECLLHVAAQRHPVHQVILIDDDSTDDSIAQARASCVPFDLIKTNVHNAAAARNLGIEAATGDWIALLDADDIWYANHLQRASEMLGGSSDVAFMSCHDWIDLTSKVIPMAPGFQWPYDKPMSGLSHQAFVAVMRYLHFGHSTVIYRTDRVREVGAFDVKQRRRHDIDLWLRMIHNHTWAYDSVRSMGYRVGTPGSISGQLANCEQYYLRCLLKNRDAYAGPMIDDMISISARRGMGLAFVDEWPEFKPMMEVAWPHLTPRYRMFYRLALLYPPAARWAIRRKRIRSANDAAPTAM